MKKKSFVFAFTGLLFVLVRTSGKLFSCDRIQNERNCYIHNITIDPQEDHRTLRFPDVLQLIIDSGSIKSFSSNLFVSLGDINFLTLKEGHVQTVNFSSETLHSLRIDKTGLTNLSIATIPNYNLNTLMINRNPIVTLPNTIRYLFALSILDLSRNRLSHISLDWFQQMNNLLVLDLSWNRIARIDGSSDLRLNRLKNFWVNNNQLMQIPWFPIGFPKLERVRLSSNYWSCNWIRSTRQQIWDRDVRLFDADDVCSGKSEGGLCCYDSVAVIPQAKYEFVEIDFDPQQEQQQQQHHQVQQKQVALEVISSPSVSMQNYERIANDSCQMMYESVRILERDNQLLMVKKSEMELKLANKVASLEEMLKAARDDLEVSEKEVSRYRLKERLDLIARTNSVRQNGRT
ncbi:uncharacterized protein LOC131428105 [Malaya genurostris]|uniref:uncharacterized protein LOC131428105 n=1 Tax=Malaya genurostris TaxID=325434 RepID=UPI0026F403A7|nr:uncharacterized protein LOC131428105 [Malaya genurostris]